MDNKMAVFNNREFGSIRVIEQNGNYLFCGKDIAKALGYQRPAAAISAHCKGVCVLPTPSNGGIQQMKFISEGDVYRLIVHSRLPGAERFEKWVFDEVLPMIRKTGGYMTASLLEQAAEKFKNKTVFEDKDGSISFEELREKSRIIGSELIKRVETGRKCPVIVYLPKSIKSIISFMGSLYSASPYVPIDYAIPMARMEKTVENLHPTAIITDTDGKAKLESFNLDTEILIFDELADGQADDAAVDKSLGGVCDLDPAYIMYTSGSTGVPKGVTISNRGVIDYIEWIVKTFPIDENSVIGMQSAFHFDNSVFDMYTTFYTGAKTMIIPEILFMYPEKLMDYLTEIKISVIFWVPTVMISVANGGVLENADLSALKLILFAGEVMPNTQLNIWRK